MTATPGRTFTVGSLVYTRAGLITLFSWLIWGDFVFNLMEQILPSLLPLLLKSNGASNEEISVVVTTLAMVMNAALNPVISYQSDRFRSRWGRRRPFIVVTTPFVVFFLAAIPFAPDVLRWMNSHGFLVRLLAMGPAAPIIIIFAALVVGFQTFNMFVAAVYAYLVPDVVPIELMGRFVALFRLFGALAGVTFNYFIFGLAQAHMKMIFGTTALVYGGIILLMCWQVKEGEYPPPPKEDHAHWWSGIRNYAYECFGHGYYWWAFLVYGTIAWSGLSTVFAVFFYRDDMGMSLDLIGKVQAWGLAIFIVLAYPFGVLVDRWGCHKTLILGSSLATASAALMLFLAVDQRSTIVWIIIRALALSLTTLSMSKWVVEVYPRARFGQFGSAGSLFASLGGIALGPLCGWWMDWHRHYRYFLIWSLVFSLLNVVAATVVYRKWKALGGPDNYRAP
jgi:maltose/moltooligosaccharide transporter